VSYDGVDEERRTSPLELLWDLVFVFAVTQVTSLLSRDLTWSGFGRSMLALALIWWAWSAFVWAANAEQADSAALRAVLLAGAVLTLVAGLAIPRAFGDRATLFASTYAGVRLMHLALYAHASRRGHASWDAITGFAATVLLGMVLLVIGSLLATGWQVALWSAAAIIDYAGPGVLTRKRLRGLQRVAVAHFAERYGTFVIICLGESIAAIGLGATGRVLDAKLVAVIALGLLITIGLWWIYFDRFAAAAAEWLRSNDDPVLAASDAYSYVHLALVAGVIVFAVGMRHAVADVGGELADGARLALCAGPALYLAGNFAFRLRLAREASYDKLLAAAALMAVFALGGGLQAWVAVACASAAVVVLCAGEAVLGRS